MPSRSRTILVFIITSAALLLLHLPFLRLPYLWDEAGYYVPAALDFYRFGSLVPHTTLPEGHPPLIMIYVGLAWRVLGLSPTTARVAMTLIAAATIAALYLLARRVASREVAVWSSALLAMSPLFFAQTTMLHLDLAVALFTTVAILFLLDERLWSFAAAASWAVLTKETAVVLLPVAWAYEWRNRKRFSAGARRAGRWAALLAPLLPLAAWALYYHHATGYWTGNREYLAYNLYSTLSPVRVLWSLVRNAEKLFVSGFNGLLTLCAGIALWLRRKHHGRDKGSSTTSTPNAQPGSCSLPGTLWSRFQFLGAALIAVYLLLLSLVGGAILPRYLLPVMPVFYLAAVVMIARLPAFPKRLILSAAAVCFVAAWFINPPYPFPFEDNLSYADFVRLHEDAAHYLQAQPGEPRILTAWPATDELTRPFLGYVQRPLHAVSVTGFSPQDFAAAPPASFDLLYLYSRRWEPSGNWLARFPAWLSIQERYFGYAPQIEPANLASRYHLTLLKQMERRGQWVKIYSR